MRRLRVVLGLEVYATPVGPISAPRVCLAVARKDSTSSALAFRKSPGIECLTHAAATARSVAAGRGFVVEERRDDEGSCEGVASSQRFQHFEGHPRGAVRRAGIRIIGGAGFQRGFAADPARDAEARDAVTGPRGEGDFLDSFEVGLVARDPEDFAELPPSGNEEIDVREQALEDGAGFGEGPEFFAVVQVEARGNAGGAGGFQCLTGGDGRFGGEAGIDAARMEPARAERIRGQS